jgi:hypothetical protein
MGVPQLKSGQRGDRDQCIRRGEEAEWRMDILAIVRLPSSDDSQYCDE